jgi:acetyl/propionyl-CoA carboxylase alpha subunit
VTPLGRGVFRIQRADGTQVIAYGAADGLSTWVFIDGDTFVIDPTPVRRSRSGQDAAALAAPMPARVTHVHVSPGQQVHTGDVLITLEAMKMELPIRATSDGVVTAVNCQVNEMVQPGTPLVGSATNSSPEPRTPNVEPRT